MRTQYVGRGSESAIHESIIKGKEVKMVNRVVIRAGRLIDGLNPAPLNNVVILIEGDRVSLVGDGAFTAIPDGARIIDASDKTVMPGMIDAHVHIHTPGGPADNYALAQLKKSQAMLVLEAYSCAMRDLQMGFTALRSLSSPCYIDIALRNAIDQGLIMGPRLRVSGQGLCVTGGHMDKPWWSPDLDVPGRTGVCDGPWECKKAARTQLKWGADVLKINPCVGDYRNPDRPWKQEMTYEEIAAICEEAHWAGKRVAAHTAGGQGITDSIRAGVDSIEHGHWLTDEQIELMVEYGTYYVPTLIVNTRSVELSCGKQDTVPEAWRWLNRVYEDKWETLRRAKEAGVKIAVGTDAGFVVSHGQNSAELEELVKGGLTPMEAIMAATRIGAECLDMEKEIGTVEPGKLADLLIVDGDPLSDIRILQDKSRIVQIFKGGEEIK